MVQTVIDCVSVSFLNLTIQGHRGLKAGTLLWQFFDHFVLIFITPGLNTHQLLFPISGLQYLVRYISACKIFNVCKTILH